MELTAAVPTALSTMLAVDGENSRRKVPNVVARSTPVSLDDGGFDTEGLFDELLADRQDIAELAVEG